MRWTTNGKTLLMIKKLLNINFPELLNRLMKETKISELPPRQMVIGIAALIFLFVMVIPWKNNNNEGDIPVAYAEKRSFAVNVRTVGELEAKSSTIISSSIRGDQGKIISLVPDGSNVKEGNTLIKIDPTPFEEKIENLTSDLKEQEAYIEALGQTLEWEIDQGEHEKRTAEYEKQTAELELSRVIYGDGPLETSRLKGAMQKAWVKYDELNGYSDDLIALEQQGFLNAVERRQAEKKLEEERDAYEAAKLQYESFVEHVHPMQIKKAETSLKQALIKQEEMAKTRGYKIGKAYGELEQAKQEIKGIQLQLKEAERELAMCDVCAPAPGMVVHREDYRSGQKRKPRVGDVLVKNQPLMDLPDLDSMIVKTKVREVDLYKIAIGKEATIEVDAYPQLNFTGKVISIGILAMSDFGRQTEEKYFELRVELDKSDLRLRPGMTTRVTIHADKVNDVVSVPIHALFNENNHNYCYRSSFGGFKMTAVELGTSNEQWAEIKSGLKEGDCVCLINPTMVLK